MRSNDICGAHEWDDAGWGRISWHVNKVRGKSAAIRILQGSEASVRWSRTTSLCGWLGPSESDRNSNKNMG